MINTVFVEVKFWLLVAFSSVVPIFIYFLLLRKRSISRNAVLILGMVLVLLAAVDVYLLRSLQTLAKISPSLADDAIFVSEISVALYVFPILFGGVGVNVISHVLITHLLKAERTFDKEHADD